MKEVTNEMWEATEKAYDSLANYIQKNQIKFAESLFIASGGTRKELEKLKSLHENDEESPTGGQSA